MFRFRLLLRLWDRGRIDAGRSGKLVPFGLGFAQQTERVFRNEGLPLLVLGDKLGIQGFLRIESAFLETE